MPQDAFTLRHLCRELNNLFSGGRINKIVQPSGDEVVFTVYNGKSTDKLFISVTPSCPRIGVSTDEFKTLDTPNFCQLLRKHLQGAKIDEISLCGFDRIVKISLTPSNEYFDSIEKVLYVELMGRYSNIILTENGKILGGNRGINMFDDGVRPLFVGQKYVFPPTQNKKTPDDKSLAEDFFKLDGDVVSFICANVQGLAKETARFIVRSYADIKRVSIDDICAYIKANAGDFVRYMCTRLYDDEYRPCVAVQDGIPTDVYALVYDDDKSYQFFDKLYLAEDYFFNEKLKKKRFSDKKERAKSIVSTSIKKAAKRVNAIEHKKKEAENLEENRIYGELLIANIYRLKQGEKQIELENYYDDNKIVVIPLDENLSPSKNAEKYYKKYNKQKRTLEAIKPQLDGANAELEYYKSLESMVQIAETEEELDVLLDEIRPKKVSKNKKTDLTVGCHVYENLGYVFKVGRSNIENDKLYDTQRKDSLWLHVKDYHSSHVYIDVCQDEISAEAIKFGAEICAYYSKCRDTDKIEVVFTKRKYVKKPKGAKPGFVTYDNFKSIIVTPKKHEEFIKGK